MSLRKFLIDVATDERVRREYIAFVKDDGDADVAKWFSDRGYVLDADHLEFLASGRPLKLERVRLDVQGTFSGSPHTYVHIIWDVPIIW